MTEFEQKVIEHEEHLKTIDKRLEKMDDIIDSNHKIATSVEKLALTQEMMIKQTSKIQADVEELKLEPAINAKKVKFEIFKIIAGVVIGAVLGALLTLIIK